MPLKTFALIPARGGSKQIPKKNLINFCGKPLLAWSILQAKASKFVDEVYVSSDCDEILSCAERYGAVAIKRPSDLATDSASSEDALIDAIKQIKLKSENEYDFFVFLQATSPLREPADIDTCIEKKIAAKANTVFSSVATGDLCVWQASEQELSPLTYQPGIRLPRQTARQLYIENGSIYVCDIDGFLKSKNRMTGMVETCVFSPWKVHEIDDRDNLVVCEALFNHHHLRRSVKACLSDWQPMLIVYDFDGVMTNNTAIVNQEGIESVAVNRSDGLGINKIRDKGYTQLILSTEANPVVLARAQKLNLEVIHDCKDKKQALFQYCNQKKIFIEKVLYVGNEVNDLAALLSAGYSVCPSDAHPSILDAADHVTRARGGEGVIREISDLL